MKPNFIGKSRNVMKKAYNILVNSINNSIPSKNNSFRIMAYNVKEFDHCNNKTIKKNKINVMEKLIDELNPNIIGYIEYVSAYPYNNMKYLEEFIGYIPCSMAVNSNIKTKNNFVQMDQMRGAIHSKVFVKGKTLNIFYIHLDVYDETAEKRVRELQVLHEYIISKRLVNVIVIGDFNDLDFNVMDTQTTNTFAKEFNKRVGGQIPTIVTEYLYSHNYYNLYHTLKNPPSFSCWTGRLVDHAFIYKPTWNPKIKIKGVYHYYTDSSDHLPLIVDLNV
jgi:hypothetical protein